MNDRVTSDYHQIQDTAVSKGFRARSLDQLAQALARLQGPELLGRLERLVSRRGQLTAELLVHLGEVDCRKLYLGEACSSMFGYCTARLYLSEAAAYRHIRAARLGRQFPLLLELVAEGTLHLTAICLLSPHLTPANHRQLLAAAVGKTKRELQLLIAEHFPQPDVPSQLRRLPGPRLRRPGGAAAEKAEGRTDARSAAVNKERPSEAAGERPGAASSSLGAPEAASTADAADGTDGLAPERARPRGRRGALMQPLAPGRFKVQLTAGQSLYDKLQQAQDLMRHELPSGDLEVICERALDLLLHKLLRRKLAVTDRPRSSAPARPKPRSRYIPAAVKRAVAARDGLRCTFVDALGRRCAETGGLELHHIEGFARGGESTVENVTLRCRGHNHYDAEQHYGAAYIEQCIRQRRGRYRGPAEL